MEKSSGVWLVVAVKREEGGRKREEKRQKKQQNKGFSKSVLIPVFQLFISNRTSSIFSLLSSFFN
jgi:hypothetical protein